MDGSERRRRAEARRRDAVLRKGRLQEIEVDLHPVRGGEALTLVTRLTAEGWSLSGRPVPAYGRAETPYRFVRGGIGDRAS